MSALARGDLSTATELLERASARAPGSSAIARDLAVVYLRAARWGAALHQANRAYDLGDRSVETDQVRAIALARLDRTGEAAELAARGSDWGSTLIGTAVGDAAAADRAARFVRERSPRGALTALVLASVAGTEGRVTTARRLARVSESLATDSGSAPMVNAARALGDQLDAFGKDISGAFRVRTSLDFATNPRLDPEGTADSASGLRGSITAEGELRATVGVARVDAAVRIDQQVYLTRRSMLDRVELTGFRVAAGVEVPLSERPNATVAGIGLRLTDVFGKRFDIHYATSIEGGPTLTIPFDFRSRIELGVFGVITDFIDASPVDDAFSSQNRDRVGQRALAAYVWRNDWLEARIEGLFIRDDAKGDAFDARGGALGARLVADLGDGLFVRTGLGVTIREYGPVGEEEVLGDASKRTEVRTALDVGVYVPIVDGFALVFEDAYVRNSARAGHEYTDNVFSLGLEASW